MCLQLAIVLVLVLTGFYQGSTERQMEDILWQQSKLKELVVEAREKDVMYKQLVCLIQ